MATLTRLTLTNHLLSVRRHVQRWQCLVKGHCLHWAGAGIGCAWSRALVSMFSELSASPWCPLSLRAAGLLPFASTRAAHAGHRQCIVQEDCSASASFIKLYVDEVLCAADFRFQGRQSTQEPIHLGMAKQLQYSDKQCLCSR